MSKQVKWRRGTTAEHSTFTGAIGEVTVDTVKDTLVVHDGITQGGHSLPEPRDWKGFTDELLAQGGVTPTGQPDQLGASQRVEAIKKLPIEFIQSGAGAAVRTARSKMREIVSVLDFGAVGDGVTDDTDAIQATVDYVAALPQVPSKPIVHIPSGRYLITRTIQLAPDIAISGEVRDIGYSYAFTHSSEIIASGSMLAMFDVTGSNVYVGNLGLYGNNSTDFALYTDGPYGRTSSQTFQNLAITLCRRTGIYLANTGITKMSNIQISNCVECGMDLSGWGDADLSNLYINTNNFDSTAVVNAPSSAVVYGVGVRIRGDVATQAQSGNINIRGGKFEFNRIGILLNAAQGVNITGINFDNNRKASIYMDSDDLTANKTAPNTRMNSSIQITGNRFLGGLANTQTPSSHIFVARGRFVTIVGNGFKKANDGAIDFNGDGGAQGPTYGVWLYNAEECTVVANDLFGAATVNSILVEHATPALAQHTIMSNNVDGTQLINPNMVKTQPVYGDVLYASGKTPIARNTAKAWVRFNGNGATPVIINSHNVATVTGAGGTYNITAITPWGDGAAATVSVRNYFGPSDAGNYGAPSNDAITVYSTTMGVLSANGDITVMVFGT